MSRQHALSYRRGYAPFAKTEEEMNGQEPSHITAMKSMMPMDDDLGQISQPPLIPFAGYTDAVAATRRLVEIYERNTAFIRAGFKRYTETGMARRDRKSVRVGKAGRNRWPS